MCSFVPLKKLSNIHIFTVKYCKEQHPSDAKGIIKKNNNTDDNLDN